MDLIEKVLSGIHNCADNEEECKCSNCPYYQECTFTCINKLLADARILLKQRRENNV